MVETESDWTAEWRKEQEANVLAINRQSAILSSAYDLFIDPTAKSCQKRYEEALKDCLTELVRLKREQELCLSPGQFKALKEWDELYDRKTLLLRRNTSLLLSIQAKEVERLMEVNNAASVHSAQALIQGLQGLEQALKSITDECPWHAELVIRARTKVKLHLQTHALPTLLKEQLREGGWPGMHPRLTTDALQTLHWMASAGFQREAQDALMSPLRLHFAFHFGTQRPTNKASKPEWPLQYLLASARALVLSRSELGGSPDAEDLVELEVAPLRQKLLGDIYQMAKERMGELAEGFLAGNGQWWPHFLRQIAWFEGEMDGFGAFSSCLRSQSILDAMCANTQEDAMLKALSDHYRQEDAIPDGEAGDDSLGGLEDMIGRVEREVVQGIIAVVPCVKWRVRLWVGFVVPWIARLQSHMSFLRPPYFSQGFSETGSGGVLRAARLCLAYDRLEERLQVWRDSLVCPYPHPNQTLIHFLFFHSFFL